MNSREIYKFTVVRFLFFISRKIPHATLGRRAANGLAMPDGKG
jgi:hypothetical protein